MSETGIGAVLATPRLRLRGLVEADAPAMHAFYGDAETMRFWDSPPARDVAETADHIRRSLGTDRQWHAAFAITRRGDDRMVGMVNYHERRPWQHRLSVGWILHRSLWRQGITREAMQALLLHCFEQLDAHRIEARIEPGNLASIHLAKRLGFAREGLLRDCLFVGGEPRSQFLFALLRPAWRPPAWRAAVTHE